MQIRGPLPNKYTAIIILGTILLAVIGILSLGTPPATQAYPFPGETPLPTPTSQPTSLPLPTNTPLPTPTGGSTPLPTSTSPPGQPTPTQSPQPTSQPFEASIIENCAIGAPPQSCADAPAGWVGVIDLNLENVCDAAGNCYGNWVVNTNPTLWEFPALRREGVRACLISQGEQPPSNPADDIHLHRPICLVNGQQVYAAGVWYYNGHTGPELQYLRHERYPDEYGNIIAEIDVYRAVVPVPNYDSSTAWNFGASYTCREGGGGGGGGGGPTPTPYPTPTPTPEPPSECPNCTVSVSPHGSINSPYLLPSSGVTLTWNCSYPAGEDPTRYDVRVSAFDGTGWSPVAERAFGPDDERQFGLELMQGLLYHTHVGAHFIIDDRDEECCGVDTYFKHQLLMPPISSTLEARADYWSDLDEGSSAADPRRTSGDTLAWNWGQFLNVHLTADIELDNSNPDWLIETEILRWRYCGSMDQDPTPAGCTEWYEETDPPQYVHLLWSRDPPPVTQEDTWVYQTEPRTVSVAYDLKLATSATYLPTGQIYGPFVTTWDGLVLRVPIVYRYRTTPQ